MLKIKYIDWEGRGRGGRGVGEVGGIIIIIIFKII